MKKIHQLLALIAIPAILSIYSFSGEPQKERIPPLINYNYYEKLVAEVKPHRAARLISLNTFLTKTQEPQSVILDTRSTAMYDLKHVKGAIHLNFSEFTQDTLDKIFAPFKGRETNIYIYCNNNFFDSLAPILNFQDKAFISKVIIPKDISLEKKLANDQYKTLALNIPTYINLYGYGYRNVYELNEYVDVNDPRIEFEGTFDDKVNK